MIDEYCGFGFGFEGVGDLLVFFFGGDEIGVFCVDGEDVVKVVNVLLDYVEGFVEGVLCLVSDGVGVVDGVYIWVGFVNFGMDVKVR